MPAKKQEPVPASISHAFIDCQSEFPVIPKNREGQIQNRKYKYADIADILKAVVPILNNHQISLRQPTEIVNGILVVRTVLTHAPSQEALESVYPVSQLGDHREMGSGLTYARRYALASMLGLATDEDVDGEGATIVSAPPVTATPQAKRLEGNEAEEVSEVILKALSGCKTSQAVDGFVRNANAQFQLLPQDLQKKIMDATALKRQEIGQ